VLATCETPRAFTLMTPGRKVKLVLASAAALGAWIFALFGDTGIRQARWMAESRAVLPTVVGRVASDRRFAGLTASVSTGCNIVVYGNVASGKDAQDLRTILADVTFPHGVAYVVRVE
jgi:hypothetical protein